MRLDLLLDAWRIEIAPSIVRMNDTKTINMLIGGLLLAALIGYLAFTRPDQPDARDLPDGQFKQTVLASPEPVLVDFYADWCGPCKIMSSILDEFAGRNSDVTVVRVNVDKNRELAGYFGVSSIPTLMVFKNGKMTARRSGVTDKNGLRAMIDK